MPDLRQDETSEPVTVTGQTTLRQSDQFRFLATWLPRVLLIMFALCCVVFTAAWLFGMSERRRAYYAANPWEGAREILGDIAWVPLAATAFYGVVLFALTWFQFRRLPAASRMVTYQADAEALTTRDAAGAELKVPWTMVREVRTAGHLLILKLKTRAWRYLPLRAFAADDRQRLQALIGRQVAGHPPAAGGRPDS